MRCVWYIIYSFFWYSKRNPYCLIWALCRDFCEQMSPKDWVLLLNELIWIECWLYVHSSFANPLSLSLSVCLPPTWPKSPFNSSVHIRSVLMTQISSNPDKWTESFPHLFSFRTQLLQHLPQSFNFIWIASSLHPYQNTSLCFFTCFFQNTVFNCVIFLRQVKFFLR
jgi:hypothetical protein